MDLLLLLVLVDAYIYLLILTLLSVGCSCLVLLLVLVMMCVVTVNVILGLQVYGSVSSKLELVHRKLRQDAHRSCWELYDWTDESDQMILLLQSLVAHNGQVMFLNDSNDVSRSFALVSMLNIQDFAHWTECLLSK